MSDVNVSVIDLDDEQLDTLFSDNPGTFKADDLESAQKKEEKKPTEAKESQQFQEKKDENQKTPEVIEISEDDENELFSVEKDEEDKQKETKVSKKVSKEEKEKEASSLNFKNLVDHFVESGKWVDFEGREDIDVISEEDFLKISEQQDDYRLNAKYQNVGDYGKAIIEYEKNGGNPAHLIEIFKERRDLQNIDLSDEGSQEEVIRAFYENQGEDEEWIEDYITTQKDKGGDFFKKDAEKKHARLLEANKAEEKELQTRQAQLQKEQEESQKAFHSTIRKSIHSKEDWSNSEKKDLEKFLLSYDKKLQDGRQVNGLFLKMVEIQQDPAKYIEFAKFIQDMDKYKQKVEKKAATETAKRDWKIIKDAEGEGYKKSTVLPDQVSAKKKDPFQLTFKT